MSKHTPGPWHAAIDMVYGNPATLTPNICIQPVVMGSPVNRSIAKVPRSELEYSEANARLIAASPDLLSAIVSLVELAESHELALDAEFGMARSYEDMTVRGQWSKQILAAHLAISKATGA